MLLFTTPYVWGEKSFTISRTESPITIDGSIDSDEWANMEIISDFVEVMPGENITPIVKTEVRACYNTENLYVSFKAYDNPKHIRAHVSKRDDIITDDLVGIIIDTHNDGVSGNIFYCNPFGNQADGQKMSGKGDRMDWDAVWTSAGVLTDDGFEVEIAIPFSSLRFQESKSGHWRMSFFRTVSRPDSRREMSWTPSDRNNRCDLCQLGHLYGLKDIGGGSSIEYLPSIAGFRSNGVLDTHYGIGLKVPIGTNITTEITINPDYSQIESDQARIDVNKQAALSYPESRPFFNEGIDLFGTGSFGWKPKVRSVYTRSINQPLVAAKLIGQLGKTQFGYIGAQDQDTYLIVPFTEFGATVGVGESLSNIFRIKHSLKPGSYIGGILTDRRYGEGFGQTIGADAVFRFGEKWNLDCQFFTSTTQEISDSVTSAESELVGNTFNHGELTTDLDGETFKGIATYASLERRGRNWGGTFMHVTKSPTFRVDNGYLSLNDKKQISGNMYQQFWPNNSYIEHVFALIGLGRIFNYEGDQWYKDWMYATVKGTFKGQNIINFDFMPNSEFYAGDTFNNNYHLSLNWDSKFSNKLHLDMGTSTGREIIRDPENSFQAINKSMSFSMDYKPNNKISIKPFAIYSRSALENTNEEIYSDFISRIRLSYQFTAATNFKIVAEYHDYYQTIDIQPLFSYQPNPFTIFYAGASLQFDKIAEWESSSTQAYMKFQYLFSI